MKIHVMFRFCLLIVAAIALYGCEDSVNSNTPVEDVVVDGTWYVTYFWDKTKDETSDFAGYSFRFLDDGTLEAEKAGTIRKGTWQVSQSSNKFIINMNHPKPLEEIDDDWLIIEKSATQLKLKDDNDEHLEELYFEKR